MLPASHARIISTPTAAPQQQGPYGHKAGSSLRRANSAIRSQEDHFDSERLWVARAESGRHQSIDRGSSGSISLDTTDEQQQQQPLRWEQQLLRRKWEQQFAGCSSWQELRQSPAFLTEGSPGNSAATFMAAAAMLARLLKQQHGHALDQQRIQWQQGPEDVSQQQAGARHLWLWYRRTVLYGCMSQCPAAGRDSLVESGEAVDTVTAAALLQATAAMGWTSEQLQTLTGMHDARRSLAPPCLALFEAGISTAMADSSSSSSQQTPGGSLSNNDAASNLRSDCPPVAVVNLVTALQALGIRSRADVKHTRDQALIAALSTSFSPHSSSNSSNRQWPRLGYPAVLKLLQGFVLKGELMSADVMDATVQAVQAHIISHPHRLLPLLQHMISLQKCKLWHEGRQTLLLFRVQLLVGLQQLPERGWSRIMEVLRYQCVLQLLGPEYVGSNSSTPGVNSSSSSNAPGRQFSRSKGQGSAVASSAVTPRSSESSRAIGRMTGKELEQLLKQQLPRVQCSFKELVDLSDCIAQLPPHTDLFVVKKLLLAAGLKVLSRSVAAAAAAEPRRGRSQQHNSSVLEPREVSSWLSHTAMQRTFLNARQRQQLAGLLLDVLGSGGATLAQLAAPEGAQSSKGRSRSRSSSGDPSFDSNSSSSRGSSRNSSSGSGVGGGWVPNALVPLLVAACDLQLPFAAGPEWWPTVMQLVLQHEHLQLLKPDQALLILQCMARSKHRPSHPEVAQLLQVISNRWFPAADASMAPAGDDPQASATTSSSRGATRSRQQGGRPRQAELGQLVDLLCVLASLKHRPQLKGGSRVGWWRGYQAVLMQVAEPPPPPQQQQQQELLRPDLLAGLSSSQQSWLSQLQQPTHQLDAIAAVKVIWAAGRLGLNPEPQLLLTLLQHLQGNLEHVELKQLVGVIVGLSTVLREHPGVLSRRAYIRLCEALLRAGEPSLQDATNLLNCFGSIAATTDAAGSADAALDAEVAAAHVGPEQQQRPRQQSVMRQSGQQMVGGKQRQRQLRPPPHVVEWLLAAVEPRLQEISSTGLVMMLWGLRKLNQKPSQHWLNRYQQVVLERAGATPRLPDYQCAIIITSLVHLGVAVETALLQELLFRVPRHNISPGLMADLTAALKKLDEPQGPMHWQQETSHQQQHQQQQVKQQQVKEQQQQVKQPAQGAGIQSFEDLELDLDALIDSARAELGRFRHSGQEQQELHDQEVVGSLAAVSLAGGAEGPRGADEAVIDPAAVKRIRSRLAVFEELLRDSS